MIEVINIMAYYECTHKDDCINNGDSFIVTLSGSHNVTTTATVCYIDKNTVCLLGDINLGTASCITQRGYVWNYTVNIKNKEYTGSCKIPTVEQIYFKCTGYKRSFDYWTSTAYNDLHAWVIFSDGRVYNYYGADHAFGTLPFIEITL